MASGTQALLQCCSASFSTHFCLVIQGSSSDPTIISTSQASANGVNRRREQTATLNNLPKLSTCRAKTVFPWMWYNIQHSLGFPRTTHQSSSPRPTTKAMRTCNWSCSKNSYDSSLIHPCVPAKLKTSCSVSVPENYLLGVKCAKKEETGTLTHPVPPFNHYGVPG